MKTYYLHLLSAAKGVKVGVGFILLYIVCQKIKMISSKNPADSSTNVFPPNSMSGLVIFQKDDLRCSQSRQNASEYAEATSGFWKHRIHLSLPSVRSLQMIASEVWYHARPQSWRSGAMMMGDVLHQHFWSGAMTAKQTHSLKIRWLWNKKLIVACHLQSETWHRAACYQREADVVLERLCSFLFCRAPFDATRTQRRWSPESAATGYYSASDGHEDGF